MPDITEKEFLQSYDITKFVQPSVATDIVLFTLGAVDNDRKVSVGPLQVLLVKRASHPCRDKWSLPGGFAIPQETLKQTAIRELREETHVINAYLKEFGTFSDSHRDPRGWIISNTWLGAINKMDCHLRADTDAWDAKWFNVSITKKDKGKIESKHQIFTTTEYTLHLDAEDNSEHLTATTYCQKVMNHGHFRCEWTFKDSDLGFDHGRIITEVLTTLRKNVQNDLTLVFEFMPEVFTIGEVEAAYKAVYELEDRVPNFRRKIEKYVIETDAMANKSAHRPAKLYIRNFDAF